MDTAARHVRSQIRVARLNKEPLERLHRLPLLSHHVEIIGCCLAVHRLLHATKRIAYDLAYVAGLEGVKQIPVVECAIRKYLICPQVRSGLIIVASRRSHEIPIAARGYVFPPWIR